MEKYYIWLIQLMGPGNPEIHKIISKYGTPEKAYNTITSGDLNMLDNNQKSNLGYITIDKAEKVLDYCKKAAISIVTLGSVNYPKLLAEIYNPPILLFYKGNLSCLDNLCITIVGAREVTPYIAKLCTRICKDLCKVGITLISGMAKGVDKCAHSMSINYSYPTVGVLACGIDYNYPYDALTVGKRLMLAGGAYISEFLPGTPPNQESFRIRNRIMAGLSRGTAVFQASMSSGSLITASYAVNENRDVFCVPPPDIFSDTYKGVVRFLRDGAIPLFNHNDIIKEYLGLYL